MSKATKQSASHSLLTSGSLEAALLRQFGPGYKSVYGENFNPQPFSTQNDAEFEDMRSIIAAELEKREDDYTRLGRVGREVEEAYEAAMTELMPGRARKRRSMEVEDARRRKRVSIGVTDEVVGWESWKEMKGTDGVGEKLEEEGEVIPIGSSCKEEESERREGDSGANDVDPRKKEVSKEGMSSKKETRRDDPHTCGAMK